MTSRVGKYVVYLTIGFILKNAVLPGSVDNGFRGIGIFPEGATGDSRIFCEMCYIDSGYEVLYVVTSQLILRLNLLIDM